MWRWILRNQKGPKDPLPRFRVKLGRKVFLPVGLEKQLEETYGERVKEILEIAGNFLTEVLPEEVETVSLILDKRGPPGWPNKKDPTRFILNLARDPRDPKNQEEIRKGLIKPQKAEEASMGVIRKAKEVPEEKLRFIELVPGLKVSLPDNENLQVDRRLVQGDYCSLYLSTTEVRLHIWLDLTAEPKELSIGKKYYVIGRDKLVERGIIGYGRAFPLERIGEEAIVDLRKIKGNKELDNFLKVQERPP